MAYGWSYPSLTTLQLVPLEKKAYKALGGLIKKIGSIEN